MLGRRCRWLTTPTATPPALRTSPSSRRKRSRRRGFLLAWHGEQENTLRARGCHLRRCPFDRMGADPSSSRPGPTDRFPWDVRVMEMGWGAFRTKICGAPEASSRQPPCRPVGPVKSRVPAAARGRLRWGSAARAQGADRGPRVLPLLRGRALLLLRGSGSSPCAMPALLIRT